MNPLRAIGFWRGRDYPDLPDPRDFIDPGWALEERLEILEYLRGGRVLHHYLGPAPCRLCGERVGSTTRTDGVYAWPEGLAHYLEAHALRPPPAFVDHVLSVHDQELSVDDAWWRAEPPTGTARAWTRLRVEVSGVPPEQVGFVARLLGLDRDADRALEATGAVTTTFPHAYADDDGALTEMLERMARTVVVVREEVEVPEELLG